MLAPYPFHPAFYELYRYKTIQARYINQESSQEIKTHSVQLWGEIPGPHSSLFMAYMHLTQDHWVDSTLVLPWERRSALEHQFLGCKLWRSTNIVTPATQILYLVSIGRRHVPSIFWWGDHGSYQYLVCRKVLPITRAWYFVLRDTTEPACHSKNPWPHIMLSRPHACLSSKACYCIFLSSIAQEHLPWPIFHVTWFPSILWAHHDTSSNWPTLSCLNWFTLAMCPWHRHMLSIGPISWMWTCSTFGSQGMIWWWILRPTSSHLQKSPQEMSFISWHRLSTFCLPPRFMTNTLAQVHC